ncbi:MAG: hypothetical protein LBE06_10060 [Azoarcus sp.]|nr:hypothetical protein [Azoarcus sp.]
MARSAQSEESAGPVAEGVKSEAIEAGRFKGLGVAASFDGRAERTA